MDYFISRFNSFDLGSDITLENFQSRVKRNFKYASGSEALIICLPGWGSPLGKWKNVEKYAADSKASFLAYEFPRGIFSDQKNLTKELFNAINLTVRHEIKELKNKYGFKKCTLICISLASSYGSLVYKDNPDINEIILVAPGENLAKDMWHGCRTQHLRNSYERQDVSENQIVEAWSGLASKNNLPAQGTKVKMFFGKSDKVLPFEFSHALPDIYKKSGLDVQEKTYPLGHYFVILSFLLFPKHFLR